MNKKIIKNLIFNSIAILVLGFTLTQSCLAIGQITKPIVLKNVLRGQEVIATLNLLNSEDDPIWYELTTTGDIAEWASFYNIEDKNLENQIIKVEVPPQSYLDVVIKFNIPNDIPNGNYKGETIIATTPPKENTQGVSAGVKLKVSREISIIVTDQEIIDFETTIIPVKYDMKKNEPLQIKVIYNNMGNVSIKPDIQLKIIRAGEQVFNAIFPYSEENPLKPFERKIMSSLIEWQTAGQTAGTYKAEINVLLNGEVIKQDDFKFTIGYETGAFLAAISMIGMGSLTQGWFTIAGCILMVAVILISIKKRKPKVVNTLK